MSCTDFPVGTKFLVIHHNRTLTVTDVFKRGNGTWYRFDNGEEMIKTGLNTRLAKKLWRVVEEVKQ